MMHGWMTVRVKASPTSSSPPPPSAHRLVNCANKQHNACARGAWCGCSAGISPATITNTVSGVAKANMSATPQGSASSHPLGSARGSLAEQISSSTIASDDVHLT